MWSQDPSQWIWAAKEKCMYPHCFAVEIGRPGTENVIIYPSQRYCDERDLVLSKYLECVCVYMSFIFSLAT